MTEKQQVQASAGRQKEGRKKEGGTERKLLA